MFDLIILAFVAVFLGFRLWSILGQEDDGPIEPVKRPTGKSAGKKPKLVVVRHDTDTNDRPYELDHYTFLKGAKKAYELIVKAYTEGNTDRLRKLLSADLFDTFNTAIRERNTQGQVLETELLRVIKADIVDIKTDDKMITVCVHFKSEQTSLIKDQKGNLIEGNPDVVSIVEQRWTFERPTTSDDNAWLLVDTETVH